MKPEQDRTSRAATYTIFAVVGMVIYVFGIGPVAGLSANKKIPPRVEDTLVALYVPLYIAANLSGTESKLNAYCYWWVEAIKKW